MKNDTYQLELFSDGQDGQAPGQQGNNSSGIKDSVFFKKIQEFQKIIYSFIWTIFIALIFFSLGVERGKKTQVTAYLPPVKVEAAKIAPLNKTAALKAEPIKKIETSKELTDKYTIQVASILKASNATREINKLKNKGLSAFSATKGKYTVIYVGTFDAKSDAQSYLQKIMPNYPGCQIRRL